MNFRRLDLWNSTTAHRRTTITMRSALSLFLLSLTLARTISYRPDSTASRICWMDSIEIALMNHESKLPKFKSAVFMK